MNPVIPVLLFAYNRPDHLRRTLSCLRENQVPLIYAFSDGPKTPDAVGHVNEIRKILRGINWCKVHLVERSENLGLGKSILAGVAEVLKLHDAIIVFEDDLICVPGTYKYLCAALQQYKDDPRVMSITGWTHPLVVPKDIGDQPYFDGRAESWSWGTWSRAWRGMEFDAMSILEMCSNKSIDIYKYGADLVQMAQMEKERNLWAVRFSFSHILNNAFCLRPPRSLVDHIGFDENGTNAKEPSKWSHDHLEQHPYWPDRWPDPVENTECPTLWQKACGGKPRQSTLSQKFIAKLSSSNKYLRSKFTKYFRVKEKQ